MRKGLLFTLMIFAAAVFASAGHAERRVALVIGNSAYRNASPLPNTLNDANAIAALFRSVGFEVVSSRNELGVLEFKRAVRDFLITAETADIAVVYYAGHGIEVNGANFLIPVDAKLARDYDVEDEAVALDRIIWALQPVRRLRLILLDACRDNPFAERLQRSVSTRAAPKSGLGKLDDVSADTLVAYAAKERSVSYDGGGTNSPFAAALLKHIAEPGLDIRIALGRVRDDVRRTTAGRQEPFIYGSLGGSIIPLVPSPFAKALEAMTPGTVAPPPVAPPPVALATPAPLGKPGPPPGDPSESMQSRLQAALEKENQASACSRDEQRLARLRSDPSADEIARLERELVCLRLKPQVQRLFESIAATRPAAPLPMAAGPAAPPPAAPPSSAPRKEEPKREEAKREEPRKGEPIAAPREQPVADAEPQGACARDAERLARLRTDPSLDAIARFDRELGCDRLRPQLRRLRESLQ
ncbi:MAG: caspase family protein [Xanthobacteraceae bacterium]|nr:caspase family protein [Xanthobacteraceae bacterium]